MFPQKKRVLILGRSASVLVDTVAMLRDLGYGANASNQFDQALDNYDFREVDLVVLGGRMPVEKKKWLRNQVRELNPRVSFLQGLGGIPRLLVAQIEEFFHGAVGDIEYDSLARALRVTLVEAEPLVVEGLWAEFASPDPVARSVVLVDGVLPPGVHDLNVPDEVPLEGSYVTARIGDHTSVLRTGEVPAAVARVAAARPLPAPTPVSTRLPWE